MKTNFHKKDCALSLAFIMRSTEIRKWPIKVCYYFLSFGITKFEFQRKTRCRYWPLRVMPDSVIACYFALLEIKPKMGSLQLAVTWYKIRHAGEQAVHWDIQNKVTSSRQICIFFVLDVPVRSLLSSMADFVPCDRQMQRAHYFLETSLRVPGQNRYRSDSRLLLKNNQCRNGFCLQMKGENVRIKASV